MRYRGLLISNLFALVFALPLWAVGGFEKESIIRFSRSKGSSNLVVPKSFEGRTGKEEFEGKELTFADRITFTRTDMKSRLQGRTNRFDFDIKIDNLRGVLWESSKRFPNRNSCMECHRGGISEARTNLLVGEEFRVLTPKPVTRGNATLLFPDGDVRKAYFELQHWFTPHQSITGGASKGKMRSFNIYQKAYSAWVKWEWNNRKNFEISSELRGSKAELYDIKREFIGRFRYKVKKGFSLELQGGILLDGFAQYDLGFSDLGAVVVSTERGAPEDLPTIYTKMKKDPFGYYTINARYDYAF